MTRATTTSYKALAALSVGALALTACSSSSGGGGAASGPKAPTDKVLHLSFLQDPGQPPDPDIYYAGEGLVLTTNTYEGLLTYKPGTATPTIEPALATKYTASADNKTFTFTLRPNVKFHDGTPFTSAAVKASFDRRSAVNQGPAYMVSDVASVTTPDPLTAVITLKHSNSAFLTYLACAYGPKMMSPTGLASNKGKDNDQTYLTTHDLGTGAYTLTQAQVGSKYQLKAFDGYWGAKPYWQTVELPVVTDSSSQQLQFNSGSLAAILHDIPSSAVASYLANKKVSSYTLPSMISEYFYVNPSRGLLKQQTNRMALLKALDVDAIVKQTYFGRGTKAEQVYPANVMSAQYAKQQIPKDTATLKAIVSAAPAADKAMVVGYDSSQPDSQIVANLVSAQLGALGLTVKVQSFPTSEVFGWVGNPKGAPDMLATPGWPDSPSPYTWGHISFDADGGLNYLHCSSPEATSLYAKALQSGSPDDYSAAAAAASATGCYYNLVNITDFMVAQPWLKGVENAHTVSNPNTLILANLSA
jgi:peptide/nickel transport system substrate-binding protein